MTRRAPASLIRVSRARARDAARVARTAEPLLDRAPDRTALTAYLADPRNIFLLASMNGRAAGFLRATSLGQLHTAAPQMFLYEVGVAQGYRRQGVGRALVERLLEYCRDRGFDEVFVLTDPGNRSAVALYRHTGAVTETPADRLFVYPLRRRRPAQKGRRGREGPVGHRKALRRR